MWVGEPRVPCMCGVRGQLAGASSLIPLGGLRY